MMSRTSIFVPVWAVMFLAVGCAKGGATPDAAEPEKLQEPEPAQAEEQAAPTEELEEAQAEPAAEAEPKPAQDENVVTVKLETTKGEIIIDVHTDWAPLGAERFLELVRAGYYNDVAFFRVMKGFMAQTGISGDPKLNRKWQNKRIKDDPVRKQNKRGMVSFATAGRNSRTTQFFINFQDNVELDKAGFAPFGKVRDMTAADALFDGYGDGPPYGKGPDQNKIKAKGNAFLKKKFPNLDYITSATVVE